MIEQVLDHIHNYFVVETCQGEFTIKNGSIDIDPGFLQDGQYFKIIGSVFNDGIHIYPDCELRDEKFNGSVWAMAVPPAVIALSGEISDWVNKYGKVVDSPYQSESFGGYSYSKGSASSGSGVSDNVNWRNVFRDRLNAYRKLS